MVDRDALELSAFLEGKRAAVLKKWERALHGQGRALRGGEFERELAPLVDELAEALRTRGSDAPAVWGAIVGELGARRAEAGWSVRDASRVVAALGATVLDTLRRPLPLASSRLLARCFGEALARLASEHARASGADQVGLRDPSLRAAFDRLAEAVVLFDRDVQPVLSNEAVERIFGRPARELRDPLLGRAAREVLRTDKAVPPQDHLVRNARSDAEHTVRVEATPLPDAAGVVVLAHDVTELRRLQHELDRADHEVQSLHARLLRLGHERSLGDLAAGTALALNNELNSLALSLKLVRGDVGVESSQSARHLTAMDAAVGRAAQMVSRLQELASRRPPSTPRAIDLNLAVMEALDLVRPELTAAATDKSVRVDAHLASTRPVLAPGPELRELLCKMLLSARDEMPGGGVVSLRTVDDPIATELLVSHPCGPQNESQQLMLEAARDLARRWGGELTQELINAHRELRLRVPPAKEAQPAEGPRPVVPRAQPLRVLVVDDDAGNRETLSELLALSGHEVDDAATSEEALRAIERRTYSAALVDLAMPGMNGLELARRLRAKHPELRIAIVTGWEPPDTAGVGDSVDAIFRKPIDLGAIDAFLSAASAVRHD
jgi:CheY-like chemotaxis protein